MVRLTPLLLAGLLAGGCGAAPDPASTADHRGKPRDWVVVTWEATPGDPAMRQLLDTEQAADDALRAAGAGAIDGNEVSMVGGGYADYFVGYDRDEMWRIIEPILDDAPVEWTRAELRHRLADPAPAVRTP